MVIDARLYALIDPEQCGAHDPVAHDPVAHDPVAHDPVALARAVAEGGAGLVQLRDKRGTTLEMIARAKAIVAALAGTGVSLLVNDRVDVALAAGAAGVHLGQDDMAPETARRLLGKDAIIGLTVRSEAEAHAAPLEIADYVGLGGVFATASKDNRSAPIGLAGLTRIAAILRARRADMPVVAIAGIDASNAGDVIGAGADGIAVISALARAKDPKATAQELRAIVDAARAARNSGQRMRQ